MYVFYYHKQFICMYGEYVQEQVFMCISHEWEWYVYACVTMFTHEETERPEVYKHSFIPKYMMTFSYQADTILTSGDKTLRKDKHKTQTSIANSIWGKRYY